MKTKDLLKLNAAIFGLIAVLHLLRFIGQWPANLAGWDVPGWLSILAVIVAGWLCWQNGKAK